jgi:heptosyltransferase III
MKRAAVICASGIGDGLLMMIAAQHLKKRGYQVTLFHDAKHELSLFFEGVDIACHPPLERLETALKNFDRVLVENDNSSRAWHLFEIRKRLPQVSFFFPTPSSHMQKEDYLFNLNLPVASNLSKGCEKLLGTPSSKENGISLPKEKTFRKHPKRIVIHPTSNDIKRNWFQSQFLSLTYYLEKEGYEVAFCVGPNEKNEWKHIKNVPEFSNLREVANYIYESGYLIGNDSGIGHLASNLGIPTLTISGNPKRVRLWRPDWALGHVITLPFPLPNFKGIHLRIRENFWQYFISTSRTLKAFKTLTHAYEPTQKLMKSSNHGIGP